MPHAPAGAGPETSYIHVHYAHGSSDLINYFMQIFMCFFETVGRGNFKCVLLMMEGGIVFNIIGRFGVKMMKFVPFLFWNIFWQNMLNLADFVKHL